MSEGAVDVVAAFWKRMQSNDFRSVGDLLSDEFVLDWPQSQERIRGRDNLRRSTRSILLTAAGNSPSIG